MRVAVRDLYERCRTQSSLQLLEIRSADLVEESAIDPGVNPAIRRIMVRIVSDPAVMMNRRVQRLGRIADVMPHDPHDVNDIGARIGDFLLSPAVLLEGFQIGKA